MESIGDIKQLFNPEHILWVGKMRDQFFATGSTDGITGVRPEILYGWKVTYQKGYRTTYFQKPIVHDLEKRWIVNSELLDTAVPYMKTLYDFLQDDNFWITLIDAEGVIIKLIGSETILAELAATGLTEGSNRGQNAPYCGLFHLVYTYKKPFILSATEHASAIDDNLAGAACPIMDHKKQEVIGFIAISGHWWNSHLHTLGLAVVSAAAISKELALKSVGHRMHAANQSIKKMNKLLQMTINSVDEGIIYCDERGCIKMISDIARQILGIGMQEPVLGTLVFPLLGMCLTAEQLKQKTSRSRTVSCEIAKNKKIPHSLYCSVQAATDIDGYIISLTKQTDAHKRAVKIAYPTAIFTFDTIIGETEALQKAKDMAKLVAPYESAVLITGESGTGKEMFAQAIHNASTRSGGPFIAINCGAIPRTLIEAELFGYEKGSFTGADKNGHPGKFELANGGTLFLDEIGDMPYDVQVSILRVLQSREVIRVGSSRPIKIDVRIISATNRDLTERMEKQLFRSDLFYRLNVFPLDIPPLRERGSDIHRLTHHFITMYNGIYNKEIKGVSPDVQAYFSAYSWPGNVRELQNVVESAMILCQTDMIQMADLPLSMRLGTEEIHMHRQSAAGSKNEKQTILAVLEETKWNIAESAKRLSMSRPTLYKRIKEYNLKDKLP